MLSLTKGNNRYPKPRRGIIYPEFNFTEESIVSIIKERMKINAVARCAFLRVRISQLHCIREVELGEYMTRKRMERGMEQ